MVEISTLSSFQTKLIGTSNNNRDGVNRQSILRRCQAGEKLNLKHQPNPRDKSGVTVSRNNGEQIGWLDRKFSKLIAPALDNNIPIDAELEGVSGRDCNITLTYHAAAAIELNNQQKGGDFPGVLWILPIFFGLVGGVIAAVIAGTTYHSRSWGGLLLIGFLITVISVVIYYSIFYDYMPF